MALTGKLSFGQDYRAAEKFADGWAGDTGEYACVIENFDLGPENDADAGEFLVMGYDDALEYLAGHDDAQIQYHADYSQGD